MKSVTRYFAVNRKFSGTQIVFLNRLVATVIVASCLFASSQIMAADSDVLGLWRTESNDEGSYLHVEIQKCEKKLCGTIVNAYGKDDQEREGYENIGKKMIWGMIVQGNGKWSGGKIWAPDTDKKYRSKMVLDGDSLKVSGCVAAGLICRSQTWSKAD